MCRNLGRPTFGQRSTKPDSLTDGMTACPSWCCLIETYKWREPAQMMQAVKLISHVSRMGGYLYCKQPSDNTQRLCAYAADLSHFEAWGGSVPAGALLLRGIWLGMPTL